MFPFVSTGIICIAYDRELPTLLTCSHLTMAILLSPLEWIYEQCRRSDSHFVHTASIISVKSMFLFVLFMCGLKLDHHIRLQPLAILIAVQTLSGDQCPRVNGISITFQRALGDSSPRISKRMLVRRDVHSRTIVHMFNRKSKRITAYARSSRFGENTHNNVT